uniref:Uncharacterized protein n=1 Tax=Erwinia amylovora ATCC BAA-2158 TaxID=889211 RepID=E5B8C4_ERWAM|nr:hypothetical protein predicted by Glimmer/Critica [Erwinia amylovora ATCC BAA-2158]
MPLSGFKLCLALFAELLAVLFVLMMSRYQLILVREFAHFLWPEA